MKTGFKVRMIVASVLAAPAAMAVLMRIPIVDLYVDPQLTAVSLRDLPGRDDGLQIDTTDLGGEMALD